MNGSHSMGRGAGGSSSENMPKMNGNTSNGMNGRTSHGMSAQNSRWRTVQSPSSQELSELLEKIRELGFVKTELELYLDTHPTCKVAIDYYHRTVDALADLMERYHAQGADPLVASGSLDSNEWNWVNMPWPWQNGSKGGRDR